MTSNKDSLTQTSALFEQSKQTNCAFQDETHSKQNKNKHKENENKIQNNETTQYNNESPQQTSVSSCGGRGIEVQNDGQPTVILNDESCQLSADRCSCVPRRAATTGNVSSQNQSNVARRRKRRASACRNVLVEPASSHAQLSDHIGKRQGGSSVQSLANRCALAGERVLFQASINPVNVTRTAMTPTCLSPSQTTPTHPSVPLSPPTPSTKPNRPTHLRLRLGSASCWSVLFLFFSRLFLLFSISLSLDYIIVCCCL